LKKCIIIIPNLIPSGPVKGSVALANGLSDLGVSVTLIALRSGPGAESEIDSKVNVVNLGFSSNFFIPIMVWHVKKIVAKLQSKANTKLPIISSCFSADLVNFFCGRSAFCVSYIRGDLDVNYAMDNRYLGKHISKIHYFIVKNFDLVFALNQDMKNMLIKKNFNKVFLIPNFLNERDLIPYKKNSETTTAINLIFVGNLITRKKPDLLIKAVAELNKKGHEFKLKIIGGGPLFQNLDNLIYRLGDKNIELVGFCNNPMIYLRDADIFVLPSVSEGTPRAVMEALFIGVPCVMRNLHTNDNLVINGNNGVLFEEDKDLKDAILKAVELKLRHRKNVNLLDTSFSQNICCKNILTEINSFI
jgi:glycosyltransferase involved in cell wall biosynthesis